MSKHLESEKVVIQSPTSFTGSARRIWRLTWRGPSWGKVVTVPVAVVLTLVAWVVVAVYTFVFGLLLVPWRLVRRGGRKRKLADRRHREILSAAERAK